MLSQVTAIAAEAAVLCETILGAVLLLAWVAIEVTGYAGLLLYAVRRHRWLTLVAPPKRRQESRWGVTVRAAGLRRNLEFGLRN